MSPIVTRLADLRRHLDHLRTIRGRVVNAATLQEDLSLQNDVLHSLQVVCQAVIGVASELSVRWGMAFADYTEAVRNLAREPRFPAKLVSELEGMPRFRKRPRPSICHGGLRSRRRRASKSGATRRVPSHRGRHRCRGNRPGVTRDGG